MYIYTDTYEYLCVYVHVRECVYLFIDVYMHMYMYMYVYTCAYVCMYVCKHQKTVLCP